MIAVRAAMPADLETIGRDAAEEWVRDRFHNGADFSALLDRPAQVALIGDYPVAAAGFIERGDGAVSWSIIGKVSPQQFVPLVRVFRRVLAATPYKWVEAHCIATFHQSHRWVKCLGFEPVDGEHCFMPDGRAFRRFIFRNERHGT